MPVIARKEHATVKRRNAALGGIVFGLALLSVAGCASKPAESDPTPDPAKAAGMRDPKATPGAPLIPDAKTMMKMRHSGSGPPGMGAPAK